MKRMILLINRFCFLVLAVPLPQAAAQVEQNSPAVMLSTQDAKSVGRLTYCI
jgi:hypothetical protein